MKLPELPEEPPEEEKPKPKYPTQKKVYRARSTPPSQNTERKPLNFFGGRSTPKAEPTPPVRSAPVTPADQETAPPAPAASGPQVSPRPAAPGRGINPGLKLRAVEAAGRTAPPVELPVVEERAAPPVSKHPQQNFLARLFASPSRRRRRRHVAPSGGPAGAPPVGTVAVEAEPLFDKDFFQWRRPRARRSLQAARNLGGLLSLVVNVILLGVVLVLMNKLNALNTTLNSVLGGLYENFVNMDNSTIATSIHVEDMPIPINFDLHVVQPETLVKLTRSVTIYGARVSITSGALTIDNAPATVTLPIDTPLYISLDMYVPVDETVLVDLDVPVNINLAQSNPPGDGQVGLHDAFLGLQNTIGPFYCLFRQDAQNATGGLVCQQGIYTRQEITP